jgi:hydrogenase maturation protease
LGPKTLVCSFGNLLRADDGMGAGIIEELAAMNPPDWIVLRDFGTSGFRAAMELGDYDRVVVIDVIKRGNRPGTIYRVILGSEEVTAQVPAARFAVSLHEVGLAGALAMAAMLGRLPGEIVLLGCEPGDVSPGLERSAAVRRAASVLAERVIAETGWDPGGAADH